MLEGHIRVAEKIYIRVAYDALDLNTTLDLIIGMDI
jgi:hypothetical protein